MNPLPAVRVNRRASDRIASGHLWVFASDVLDRQDAEPGGVVRVVDFKGRPLGSAHFSSTSQICLRLLSYEAELAGKDFFSRRIAQAEAHRRRVVTGSNAYRMVHAEGDLLPALIVDRYAGWFVIQTLDQGMDRAKPDIVEVLKEQFSPSGIVERNEAGVRKKEGLPLQSGVLYGEAPGRVEVQMNKLTLYADLMGGQKTGVFLDQRENYVAAAEYAQGRALDCFTSTGGFALHMASRCDSVEAVDSSAQALETARANCKINGIGNVQLQQADVFDLLAGKRSAARTYSTIVLDPPAFAKSRDNLEGAVRGYKEINLRALQLLERGGILITCSCSHHVSEAMLLEAIAAAALDAGRVLRIIERRTQGRDHPILLTVPETHYLKCFILEVL